MAARGLVAVAVTLTTLDRGLARTLEPRAPTPERRLAAMRELSGAGVPVSVLASPMIPALNDHELERILEAAADAGAERASYTLLRLPHELRELFTEWLHAHAPGRARHVLSLLRESRDGGLYVADFGTRMKGTGAHAELLAKRFRIATRRLGMERLFGAADAGLRSDLFAPPPAPGDQLSLF
jgi:DNA repair photolyase